MGPIGAERLVIYGPSGVRLTLDRSKAYPESPGDDTPELVELVHGTATLRCALETGVLDAGHGCSRRLQVTQVRWLDQIESAAIRWTWKGPGDSEIDQAAYEEIYNLARGHVRSETT